MLLLLWFLCIRLASLRVSTPSTTLLSTLSLHDALPIWLLLVRELAKAGSLHVASLPGRSRIALVLGLVGRPLALLLLHGLVQLEVQVERSLLVSQVFHRLLDGHAFGDLLLRFVPQLPLAHLRHLRRREVVSEPSVRPITPELLG